MLHRDDEGNWHFKNLGELRKLHDLPHKLKRDREYVASASWWLDIKIMAQTLYCILTKSFRT